MTGLRRRDGMTADLADDYQGPFALLYVSGWCRDADEPLGGRCVSTHTLLSEAREAFRDWQCAARRAWGDGDLVIVDRHGGFVYSPVLRCLHDEALLRQALADGSYRVS